ncbi:hypothetical protein B0H67DRAFT_608534 [Lasiosphaeris hirsuta]|uniref:Uncharacterized protein n=1 Tax=Lasiosphaeris hirsuta TaxID=260670 RepID=A0AA40APR4_9PEZI|nr:hypothetical protein B0H67DRAFT_608534 [Lasiosphaeris hirsuta]
MRRADYYAAPFGVLGGSRIRGGKRINPDPPIPPLEPERQEKLLREKKVQFEKEAEDLQSAPGAGAIYGNTLESLVDKDDRLREQEDVLTPAKNVTSFTTDYPYVFNPYPDYNSVAWKSRNVEYVPCAGPAGTEQTDILVFKGHPRNLPAPGFGSYRVLGIDQNLCFERETRLGRYGAVPVVDRTNHEIDWEQVNWGELQNQCRERNKARFASGSGHNAYVGSTDSGFSPQGEAGLMEAPFLGQEGHRVRQVGSEANGTKAREPRTALLLRSYTGKLYNDNDKQIIRSLITELSLRSGGEYEVFLFVNVKEETHIWESEDAYQQVVRSQVPQEFWNITVLWDNKSVKRVYENLTPKALKVHNGQFLSVQIFMQEHREFDFAWNWEMDSRVTGHHYDFLTKLVEFSRKQPRRGLWERNERFYIPSIHGGYDTDFRAATDRVHAGESIWGPPPIPFIDPIGPDPPVATPEEDDYQWGVGEEADIITVSPMFNPVNSNWILRDQVWGYRARGFPWGNLPRRASIITQVRVSRTLIDVMHAETLRGNHLGSEMVAQTVALLHGLKAVYAPIPVFFDRPWDGARLAHWFNGGPKGVSGSFGSAMGWGQEGRFQGATWYFRAVPPQRMYNNWMGYEDTGIGGPEWEAVHGRACLPTMLLHPVKEVRPTEKGTSSDSFLPYK